MQALTLRKLSHKADQQGVPLVNIPVKWSLRAFQALDFDSRGYIFKDEILAHIKESGTYKS
jgi:hypothetical protein